jgi:hypothetical protein
VNEDSDVEFPAVVWLHLWNLGHARLKIIAPISSVGISGWESSWNPDLPHVQRRCGLGLYQCHCQIPWALRTRYRNLNFRRQFLPSHWHFKSLGTGRGRTHECTYASGSTASVGSESTTSIR